MVGSAALSARPPGLCRARLCREQSAIGRLAYSGREHARFLIADTREDRWAHLMLSRLKRQQAGLRPNRLAVAAGKKADESARVAGVLAAGQNSSRLGREAAQISRHRADDIEL